MDTNPSIWIGIVILLGLSAFFASSETSLFSLSRLQVQHFRKFSPHIHQLVDFFLTRPRRTLVTILMGNEIVNLLTTILITSFYSHLLPDASWETITLYTLATSTPLIMIFGDITPKTMAVRFPMEFVRINTLLLRFIYTVLSPIRSVFAAISGQLISLIAGSTSETAKDVTEEDIKVLVQAGAEEGVIGTEEQKMIFNVFRFGDTTVSQVMTPKERVVSLPQGMTVNEMIKKIKENSFSRIPIYKDSPDNIIGILHTKELLKIKDVNAEPPIDIVNKPLFITPDKTLEGLFKEFRSQRTHLAVVVDMQNQILGIVTMDDILEELFGALGQEERKRSNVS